MTSFSDDINSLLPSGYKRLNRIPLTADVLSTIDPLKKPVSGDYCGLRPFVTATFKRSFSGLRVTLFTCLLRASSN